MASDDFKIMQGVGSGRNRFWAQLGEVSSSLCRVDIVVLALIVCVGIMHFFLVARARVFFHDDVFFADSGRSLIERGFYGINGYPEANMPPGLSALIGLVQLAGGQSRVVYLHVMTVFGTLGFLVSYELLRRQLPRVIAATICLLLILSRTHFELVTQWVFPSYPYFFAAMSALLAARKLESATHFTSRVGWGTLLTALISASLMFASAGIAFLAAIVAHISAQFFRDRRLALGRFRTYFAILIVGMAVQGLWMSRQRIDASAGIAASEWSLPGFPQSYVSQLKVKSGNYPELGMATPSDFLVRVLKNTYQHSYLLSQTLLSRSTNITSMSILVLGPLLMIALGWCYSVFRTGGGLQEWYFAGYECIYILWPWTLETRFFLPIAPLACLYIWRGGEALVWLAKNKPRLLGAVGFPLALLLTAGNWFWMYGVWPASHLPLAGLQDEVSFLVWLLTAILAGWLLLENSAWLGRVSALVRWRSGSSGALRTWVVRVSQVLGTAVVLYLLIAGVRMQIKTGRANLDLNSPTNHLSADAAAGAWIRLHTGGNAVVMARHVPITYHYSERKVVWFPPSSDPHLLMEGIKKQRVGFVIVVRRENSYYLPPDEDCFFQVLKTYPEAFRLIDQASDFRIFQLAPQTVAPTKVIVGPAK
jgi:hypothetical protein